MYLLDNFIVEAEDIIGSDVCGFVLLQQGEFIPEEQHTSKYGGFLWIQRSLDDGGVGHGEAGLLFESIATTRSLVVRNISRISAMAVRYACATQCRSTLYRLHIAPKPLPAYAKITLK